MRSLAVDATGQWLASGSDDGWVRVWEVRSGRSMRAWDLGAKVRCVAWCPAPGLPILAAAAGNRIALLPAGMGLLPSTGIPWVPHVQYMQCLWSRMLFPATA